jgi:hypothetical protein
LWLYNPRNSSPEQAEEFSVLKDLQLKVARAWAAGGFHNFRSYRIRVLFFCGKVDLCPRLSPMVNGQRPSDRHKRAANEKYIARNDTGTAAELDEDIMSSFLSFFLSK